ncbi:hypothetical protein LXL04_016977 [Taraxacum kok-saghyz]
MSLWRHTHVAIKGHVKLLETGYDQMLGFTESRVHTFSLKYFLLLTNELLNKVLTFFGNGGWINGSHASLFRRRPEFETSRGAVRTQGVPRDNSPHTGLSAKDLSEHSTTRYLHTPYGLLNPMYHAWPYSNTGPPTGRPDELSTWTNDHLQSQQVIIYAGKANKNAFKALITAEYVGVGIKFAENFEMFVSNKTPKFLKINPYEKVPVLETPDGPLFESNAIARYGKDHDDVIFACNLIFIYCDNVYCVIFVATVSRLKTDTSLFGSSLIEYGQVEQWIDFASLEIDSNMVRWFRPIFGYDDYNAPVSYTLLITILDIQKYTLGNKDLDQNDKMTLADIITTCNLYLGFKNLMTKTFTSEFPHIEKYFWTMVNQPNFSKVLWKIEQRDVVPPVVYTRTPTQPKEAGPKKEENKESVKVFSSYKPFPYSTLLFTSLCVFRFLFERFYSLLSVFSDLLFKPRFFSGQALCSPIFPACISDLLLESKFGFKGNPASSLYLLILYWLAFPIFSLGSSFRKSASMNNLAQYDEQPQESNIDTAGYASDDVVHLSARSRERKRGVPWTEEDHR